MQRAAFVYIRQSSASQVKHNRESTPQPCCLDSRFVAQCMAFELQPGTEQGAV